MNSVLAYIQNFVEAAKGKLTTYIGIVTLGTNELINRWDALVAIMPHWVIEQKPHIASAGVALMVWSRIRRELADLGKGNPPTV